MTAAEQRKAAKQFAADWKGRGDEKQETALFWTALLAKVYGVAEPDKYISFEVPVKLDHTSFIDGLIPATHVLIEQKGADIDLTKGYRQSDGSILTPFKQAHRYAGSLPHNQNPRWIVVCNFQSFEIHDMNWPNEEPEVVELADLEKEYHRLNFLVDTGNENIKKEMEISLQAGQLVGVLYDALLKRYKDPDDPETLKSLNALCVRLVFCLYAEDSELFGRHLMFHDYLKAHAAEPRQALINLFKVLDTRPEDRDPYWDDDLLAFPYVNGGLFADENIIIPRLDEEIVELILHKASEDFDWSAISPTIFGAVFESTLNPETRRSGGMHYTSIENIHKVIDPLFLDELREEVEEIKRVPVEKTLLARAKACQQELAGKTFLDPACGSGNFLTETYLSLRRLENELISILYHDQMRLGDVTTNPIRVSIEQFYGIEINDFAVTVAKTALWIAESQMRAETEQLVAVNTPFLPLKTSAHIVEGNALRMDWEDVVPRSKLNYIMGNPPFVGHQWRSKEQAEDLEMVCHDIPKCGKLDYVCGWYNKAADYMQGTNIHAAFVSTNSICQGESVGILWKPLFGKEVKIEFAHRSFAWSSESKDSATVHCVIVGFTCGTASKTKLLFESERSKEVSYINGYLLDAPDIFIQSRGKVLTKGFPEMTKGSQPTDGGHLLLSVSEKEELIRKYPKTNALIKRFVGSDDLIKNKNRYCLWLKGISPAVYHHIPFIMQRLKAVAEVRRESPTDSVRRDAETPMLFTQIRQPDTNYLAVPEVSSENRRYIPISFLPPEIIGSNKLYMVPNATLYMFGVMISNAHMAWMRAVAGRLEMRYSYSPAVYNNFPWPMPTEAQKAKIEQTAQAILDARALYPDSSLADLYDETIMPSELRKAHQDNDRAVMDAYGFVKGHPARTSESACVAELMKLYQKLVQESAD